GDRGYGGRRCHSECCGLCHHRVLTAVPGRPARRGRLGYRRGLAPARCGGTRSEVARAGPGRGRGIGHRVAGSRRGGRGGVGRGPGGRRAGRSERPGARAGDGRSPPPARVQERRDGLGGQGCRRGGAGPVGRYGRPPVGPGGGGRMSMVPARADLGPVDLQLPDLGSRMSLRQQVTEALRGAVVSGVMEPGELYSAPNLAAMLGVSATPVREAMLDLAKEGLIEAVRNKGFRVIELTDAELDQLTELRSLLEVPTVAAIAERYTDAWRADIDALSSDAA